MPTNPLRTYDPGIRDGGPRDGHPLFVTNPQTTWIARAANRPSQPSPPLRLLRAVLEYAIRDLSRDERARREAREWFESKRHADWPCSFPSICDAFGLDAQAVRAAVLGGDEKGAVGAREARSCAGAISAGQGT